MKLLIRHIPGVHLDPIWRDLLVVFGCGLMVAAAIVSVGFVIFH